MNTNEYNIAEYVASQSNVPIGLGIVALNHSRGNIKQAIELLHSQQFVQIAWKEAREFNLL